MISLRDTLSLKGTNTLQCDAIDACIQSKEMQQMRRCMHCLQQCNRFFSNAIGLCILFSNAMQRCFLVFDECSYPLSFFQCILGMHPERVLRCMYTMRGCIKCGQTRGCIKHAMQSSAMQGYVYSRYTSLKHKIVRPCCGFACDASRTDAFNSVQCSSWSL